MNTYRRSRAADRPPRTAAPSPRTAAPDVPLPLARLRARWVFAALIAIGPIVGYVLSRGPGLPAYTDDVGNWGETLGVGSGHRISGNCRRADRYFVPQSGIY